MRLPEPDPDDVILRLLAEGDLRAIEHLHARYYERLFFSVRKFIPDNHAAASVVNDLLLTVWEKRDSLDLRKPILPYLYRAARNRSINYLRDTGRPYEILTPNDMLNVFEDPTAVPVEDALLADDLMQLWTVAELHMTHRVRQTFIMERQESKTKEEIAEAMGITVNAVEKNLARAWKVIDKISKLYFGLLIGALTLS